MASGKLSFPNFNYEADFPKELADASDISYMHYTVAASDYLRKAGDTHGTVEIQISVGNGPGSGQAWGCDLSYDYIKINAEYTT